MRFAANILDVQEGREDGTQLLALSGELDASSAPDLRERLAEVATRGDGALVVDLTSLDFIDSTGLSVLLNARRRLTRRSRPFAVVCPEGHVRRILEVTKLLAALGCHSSRSEALASVGQEIQT